jgi:serine/threonine-protein kinase
MVKKGPPQIPLALSIMRQVAAALSEAAEHSIVHRDIKPENIMLTRKGQVKVADFGLARCFAEDQKTLHLTQSGVTMGTPLYMSPEQVQGQPLDARTDIYSFGVTCYHMLVGEPPFKGDTPFEVALQHVQSQAKPLTEVRPDLPVELSGVIHKMMAKVPGERYQTARELLQEVIRLRNTLTAALKGKSGSISLVATGVESLVALEAETLETPKTKKRGWLPWVAAASIVLALMSGAAFGLLRNRTGGATSALVSPKIPAGFPTDPDPNGSQALKEKEKRLRQAAKDYANPGSDRAIGLSHQVELAVFLLDQRRFEEADRFFKELTDNGQKVQMYVPLGRIGHAIVLAYQDKAVESMKLLEDSFSEKRPMMLKTMISLMNQYPHLHEQVAKAIDRNKDNNQTLPAVLEKVRKPEQLIFPAEIKGKQKAISKGNG